MSELRKSRGRASPAVRAWGQAQRTSDLGMSVMTAFELEMGIRSLERRDGRQGDALRHWLERDLLPAFRGRLLPLDAPTARRAAALHVPDPRPDRDAFIAATALVHGLTVVTRNLVDFEPLGVAVLDPWTYGS